MIFKLFLIIFVLFAGYAYAVIAPPPVLRDEPLAEQQYFKTLYDNHNKFEIITTAPNGNRRAEKGRALIYNNSGTLELWVNSDGVTAWQKI